MELKTKEVPNWLQRLCVIDTESIAEKLQDEGFCDCDRLTTDEIQYALMYWFKSLLDAIEDEPHLFIKSCGLKHFTGHLPEPVESSEELFEPELKGNGY